MELWIRSQDREDLVKSNALYVINNQIWNEVPFYENHKKIGLTVSGHNHKLAEYPTKERALEVLDEIHQRLINIQYLELVGTDYISNQMKRNGLDCVYQMPAE